MAEKLVLTPKQARVLAIMQAANEPMFADDIAAQDTATFDKGARSVSVLMNGFVTKGLVSKEKVAHKVVDKEDKETTKEHTCYTLTDAGRSAEYELKSAD